MEKEQVDVTKELRATPERERKEAAEGRRSLEAMTNTLVGAFCGAGRENSLIAQ